MTWRGKSRFTRVLEKRGIRQIVARPKRPQTLGKIERFWGTMWREFLEGAVFLDLEDARVRIGHFIDYYNFQRPHRGIDGLVPADRFFGAGSDVLRTLKERVAAHALELARHGKPKSPFYVTGQVDGQSPVPSEGIRAGGSQRLGRSCQTFDGKRSFRSQEGFGSSLLRLGTPAGHVAIRKRAVDHHGPCANGLSRSLGHVLSGARTLRTELAQLRRFFRGCSRSQGWSCTSAV